MAYNNKALFLKNAERGYKNPLKIKTKIVFSIFLDYFGENLKKNNF